MKTEQARARVTAAQAELSRLEEQFDRHTMKAPFDGWVSAEHTEIGQWVMQGDPVAEVVELQRGRCRDRGRRGFHRQPAHVGRRHGRSSRTAARKIRRPRSR